MRERINNPKAFRAKSIGRLFCLAQVLRAHLRRVRFRLALAEQSFDSFPERSSGLWRAVASDEHGDVGAIQNAPG